MTEQTINDFFEGSDEGNRQELDDAIRFAKEKRQRREAIQRRNAEVLYQMFLDGEIKLDADDKRTMVKFGLMTEVESSETEYGTIK